VWSSLGSSPDPVRLVPLPGPIGERSVGCSEGGELSRSVVSTGTEKRKNLKVGRIILFFFNLRSGTQKKQFL
jgi:hypothetical protein